MYEHPQCGEITFVRATSEFQATASSLYLHLIMLQNFKMELKIVWHNLNSDISYCFCNLLPSIIERGLYLLINFFHF